MPEQPSHEELLIRRAVEQGLLTPARVDECRRIRMELAASGALEPLSEIVVRKGYLSRLQIQSLKKDAGIPLGQFGDYEILTRLGSGGMGTVYKARRTSTGQIAALKTLNLRLIGNQSYIDRFMREIRSAARLSHPNIVRILDVGAVGENHYYAMEFIDGEPLSQIIETRRKLPEPEAARVALAVASALQAIHRTGMVHRDIKPPNILISKTGEVKICDFGLAKTAGNDASLTTAGTKLGTPFYMSPEQLEDVRTLDARSDLYSLGATLYHAVTGFHPYEGRSARSVITKRLSFDSSAPLPMEGLSPAMRALLETLMARDPVERYQSADEVVADLQRFLSRQPLAAAGRRPSRRGAPAEAAERPRKMTYDRPRSSSNSWVSVVAILLLLAIGGGIVIFSGSGKKREPPPSRSESVASKPQPATPEAKSLEPGRPVVANPTPKSTPAMPTPRESPRESPREEPREAATETRRKIQEEISSKAKQADDLALGKEYTKALEVYRQLTAKYPELAAEQAMIARIKPLEREAEAAAALDAATTALKEKSWANAAGKLEELKGRLKESAAVTEHLAEIDRMLAEATGERSAAALLEKAHTLKTASSWDEAIAALREAAEKHAATETVKAVDLAATIAEIESIRMKELNDRARTMWEEAEKARDELRYKEAADLFAKFNETARGADFAKDHDGAKALGDLENHRQRAAEKLLSEARRLQRNDPGKALNEMFGILEKFADSKWLTDRKRKEIDGAIDKLLASGLTGSVRLNGSVKGSVQVGGGSPFGFSGSGDIPLSAIGEAVGGEIAATLFQPLFRGAKVTGGSLRGTRSGRTVTLTGTISMKGSAGSVGDVELTAGLTGTMELSGDSLSSFELKSVSAPVKSFIGHPGTASVTIRKSP